MRWETSASDQDGGSPLTWNTTASVRWAQNEPGILSFCNFEKNGAGVCLAELQH